MKVVDTNVLLYNPRITEEKIVVPYVVLEELDRLKVKNGITGYHARRAVRYIEDNIRNIDFVKSQIDDMADNKIINIAITKNLPLVTKDLLMSHKAKTEGVEIIKFNADNMKLSNMYTGYKKIIVTPDKINEIYSNNFIKTKGEFYNNQIVELTDGNSSAYGMYRNNLIKLLNLNNTPYDIKPRDIEQKIALSLLMDEDISMVTLSGTFGTSKTFLALASALDQVQNKTYKKLLLAKPPVSLSKDLDVGFLPGTKEEKYINALTSISSNLESMMYLNDNKTGKDMLLGLIEQKQIEIVSLQDIMGASYKDSIMILDEGQLLDKNQMRAVASRIGENSKMIITGDIAQQACNNISPDKSGLFTLIESMKNAKSTAHLTMKKQYRSELAKELSKYYK